MYGLYVCPLRLVETTYIKKFVCTFTFKLTNVNPTNNSIN